MKTYIFQLIIIFTLLNTFQLSAIENDSLTRSLFDRSIEELIEQEVTIATKSSQKLSQTPSAVSVITAEEIKIMGFRDLEEVLQMIPGFTTTQTRLGTIPVGIRGVSDIRQGARLLVLLDGTPYNDVMYGASILFGKTFNLDAVEKIEVIRGPGSALYGRNAFSGVVNIITKKAKSDNNIEIGTSIGTNNIDIGSSIDNFNTYDIRGSYSIKKEVFNANIMTKYYSTDGTNSKYNNGEGGESIWNLSHDNIYLNANAEYNNFRFSGSFSQRIDGSSTGTPYGDFITNGSTKLKIGTYNLTYNKNIKSNTSISIKAYGRNESRSQDFELATPNTSDTFNLVGRPFNQIYPEGGYAEPIFDAYTNGLEIELSIQPIRNNRLLAGIQGDLHGIKNASVRSNYDLSTSAPITYTDNDGVIRQYSKSNMPHYAPGWIRNNGHDYQNAAFYLQDVHYLTDNLSFTLGGRLDYDSEVGFVFNPRMAMVWTPSNFSSIKLLYGKAYRAPTTNEQYKIMGADMGNESLNHEIIKTGELAASLNFDKLYTQVSLYYNRLSDIILQLYINDSSNVKSYFNQGENKSFGLEFEAKYKISQSVYTYGNYSYTQSEDIRNSYSGTITNPHANIAKHTANLGVSTRWLKVLNWSIYMRYVGPIEKFRSQNILNESPYVSQNRVGDYTMLNSTILLSNIFEGFNISLQFYNILDTEYYFQDDVFSYQPKQPGRQLLLRASYNFHL